MHILEEIKAHPYITGGIVIGGVALLFIASSGSKGGSTAAVASGPSDAVQIAGIQAGASTAVAQSQANAQANTLAASLAALKDNNATALSEATLQANTAQTINSQNLAAAIKTQATAQTTTTNNQATLYGTQLIAGIIANPNATPVSPTVTVDSLYHSVLGRNPDAAGLAYWTSVASNDEAAGVSTSAETAKLLAAFQNSAEYQAKLSA